MNKTKHIVFLYKLLFFVLIFENKSTHRISHIIKWITNLHLIHIHLIVRENFSFYNRTLLVVLNIIKLFVCLNFYA